MNVLAKKEIRLLLPVWLAVLVLGTALPWIGNDQMDALMMAPVFLFFGMILLAVDSFGREFSLGTFSSLMAQPIDRRQIWRTKIAVLFSAAALIFAAYFVSCELRLHRFYDNDSLEIWGSIPDRLSGVFSNMMFASVAVWFVALTGGLWTTILLRQISASFWIAFLAPLGFLLSVILCLPAKYADHGDFVIPLLYVLAGIYAVAGFWLAHWLFHRAQDVAWTGGVISFSKWRYFDAGDRAAVPVRRQRRPLAALLNKEFQLHSISLFCVGSLLLLHFLVILIRKVYGPYLDSASFFAALSNLFWTLWLVMPLIIGGSAVAEERKLGVIDGQFCLPVSRRRQFLVKFIPVMIFGTLLGGVLPILLETTATRLGAPTEPFRQVSQFGNEYGAGPIQFEISVVLLAAGLAWLSFFASTLARNFLQALSLTVVCIVGCCLAVPLGASMFDGRSSILGILPWPSLLPILIGIPTVLITFLWLVYRNFNWFQEGWRLWRRNLLGIIGAILFVFVGSALLYNRVWEIFEPAEPAHGPAIFSKTNPPILQDDNHRNLLVRLSDGRVWFDTVAYPIVNDRAISSWKRFWWFLDDPRPTSLGPRQFLAGSNWVSTAALRIVFQDTPTFRAVGLADTVGIRSSGTLWISSRSGPGVWTIGDMSQFGSETNWQQVIRQGGDIFLLLKKDGTLWLWGTYHTDRSKWLSARNYLPQRIGTNTDWKEISRNLTANARQADGSTWTVLANNTPGLDEILRQTNFDQIPLQTLSWDWRGPQAYIGNDGTLRIRDWEETTDHGGVVKGKEFLRLGQDTNWMAVAISWPTLMALKADGSLWKWKCQTAAVSESIHVAPTRLSIHSDWVGLTATWNGAVALAADGSLWFWPDANLAAESALKLPKQPKYLSNVFGQVE